MKYFENFKHLKHFFKKPQSQNLNGVEKNPLRLPNFTSASRNLQGGGGEVLFWMGGFSFWTKMFGFFCSI